MGIARIWSKCAMESPKSIHFKDAVVLEIEYKDDILTTTFNYHCMTL